MKNNLFDELTVFDECCLRYLEKGTVLFECKVTERNLNPYGSAHGGYLYTVCDTIAGLTGATMGSYCVTQQASVNYLHPAAAGNVLRVHGSCLHDGKATKVIRTAIRDEKGKLLCEGTFTMFVVGKVEEDNWMDPANFNRTV